MKTTSSRKPGGQPGNSNAVKHGLFCRKNRLAASTDFRFYSECRETVEQIQDSLKNKRVCRQNPTADHARAVRLMRAMAQGSSSQPDNPSPTQDDRA